MSSELQQPPVVVVAVGAKIVAMNAHTGQRLWQHEVLTDRVQVDTGRVFALTTKELLGLDLATGRVLWKVKLPASGYTHTLMVYAGVVLVGGEGEVAAFAPDTGACLWHDPFKGFGTGKVGLAGQGVSAPIDRS